MPDPITPYPPSNPGSGNQSQIQQEQQNDFLGPVNGALGGLPVAEKTQNYFVTYKGAGGTGPEIIDQTAIFITNLIDYKGNISKPSEDYDSLYNLIQNFEVGKNVIIRNNLGSKNNSQIEGKQKITNIGRQETILFSQTGSSQGANIDELNFVKDFDDDEIPSFLFWLNKGATSLSTGVNTITNYNTPFLEPDSIAAAVVPISGEYQVEDLTTGPASNIQYVVMNVWAQFLNYNNFQVNGFIRLMKDGVEINESPFTILPRPTSTTPQVLEVSTNFQVSKSDLDNSDFKINISIGSSLSLGFINFRAQFQSPQISFPNATEDYWFNNSGNNLWLTASQELSLNYEQTQNSQNIMDVIEPGFNFSPPSSFIVKPGDKIRFEYNPETEYTIYEVIEPIQDIDGRLKLRLNTLVPGTVNLNNFVLHRVNSNNPTYIIVDVKKNDLVPNTEEFEGILLPEYPTQELKDNLENILLNLKEKGILSNEN